MKGCSAYLPHFIGEKTEVQRKKGLSQDHTENQQQKSVLGRGPPLREQTESRRQGAEGNLIILILGPGLSVYDYQGSEHSWVSRGRFIPVHAPKGKIALPILHMKEVRLREIE